MASTRPRPRLRALLATAGLTIGFTISPNAAQPVGAADPPTIYVQDGLLGIENFADTDVRVEVFNPAGDPMLDETIPVGEFPINPAHYDPDPDDGIDLLLDANWDVNVTGISSGVGKHLHVVYLFAMWIDADIDTVGGDAEPYSTVVVEAFDSGDNLLGTQTVTTIDDSNQWQADFTAMANLQVGDWFRAFIVDNELDYMVDDYSRSRGLGASLTDDGVWGNGWPHEVGTADVSIDDVDGLGPLGPFMATIPAQDDAFHLEANQIGNPDLTRGDIITVTDGIETLTHTLTGPLSANLSEDGLFAWGEKPENEPVEVLFFDVDCPERQIAGAETSATTWELDLSTHCPGGLRSMNAFVSARHLVDPGWTTAEATPIPPDPGLRAQLMSSGLGVDIEGWNWAWDESSGVEVELFAPDGSGPIATADGFPSPLEHGHHFWVAFDRTYGPDYRIVATGYDSGITREVIVRDVRISHADRVAGTVTGTTTSADPVNVTANTGEMEGIHRIATPTDEDLDGVFEWEVDFTTVAGTGESGGPLVPPIDVLTGDAQLGSTGAKYSTPRIQVQTSGQQWFANVDWLDHLDHDVYLAFDNGAQHFETSVVRPWINELGNASENFDLNSIDGLTDAFGDGAGWTVSVVADLDDAVLAELELPLLTLDSVNTTTGAITGTAQEGLLVDLSTGGPDGWADEQLLVDESMAWSWTTDVGDRQISAQWHTVGGNGHYYQHSYAWPSFTYFLNYDEATASYDHFLSSFHGAPLGMRGGFPGTTVTINVDDPATPEPDDYTFTADTYAPHFDAASGFEVDLFTAAGISPEAVGPGWTFTATSDIATPMSKTLVIDQVSVVHVDNDAGTASGTCTIDEQEWIVQVGYGDVSESDGENLYPECMPDGTWSVNFDASQGASYVWASYQDGDLDVNTAAWYPHTDEPGNPPWIAAIVRSGTVQFHGDWSGDPMSITIDGAYQDTFNYDDCAQGCDWLPVNVGSLIVVSDGTTTRELTVTNLATVGVNPLTSVVTGTSGSTLDVNVWVDGGASLNTPHDGLGTWTADFSVEYPFGADGVSGMASQRDDEGNETWAWWATPRMHVEPHGVVVGQGGWYEGDTVVVETFNPGDDYLTDDYLNRFEVTAGSSDIGPQDSWRIDDLGEFGVGYTVVARDGQTTRVHVVRPVTVEEIATEFDTVSGTTTLQLDDRLQVRADHCSRDDVPATAGSYTADFSVPGAQPHEQNTCDLDPGSSGQVQHFDDDGDFTILWWNLPEHRQIEVYPEFDLVGGWDAELTLTVERGGNQVYPDGPDPATGYNGFALWEDGFDLLPGDLVTVSDGETTKDHLVRSHTITSLTEAPGNTVAGTALPGTTLFIRYNTIESQLSDDNIESATIIVDGTGNWDYQFTNDVRPGTAVEVIEFDLPNSDNDQTFVVAYIPNPPTFMASLDDGSFFGDGWPVGDVVTISVDDPATTEPVDYTVDPYPTQQRGFPWATHFNTDGGWDLQPGYVVTVTTDPGGDGIPDLEKTLTVVDLTVDGIDPGSAIVTGRAEPGATVYVFAQNEWEFAWRNVVAEPAGSGDPGFWMADLSMLGPNDDGDGTIGVPLASNTGFAAQVFDADDDATNYGSCFECDGGGHPWLMVLLGPFGSGISGEQFDSDGPFTVTLDDPDEPNADPLADPDDPDYTWVVPDDFPDGGASVGGGFWLDGPFRDGSVELTPGHVVTATDGVNYREHTIRSLSYEDFDLTANTVSGTAGSAEVVEVSVGNAEQWRTRQVHASDTPDESGNWTVDFSSFPEVLPLTGLGGLISISDNDDTPGDQTGISWGPPYIAVGIDVDGPDRTIDTVWGGFWFLDDQVEMWVTDPAGEPKFGPVQGTVDKDWFNGFGLTEQPTDLAPGDLVHVLGLQSGDLLTHTVLDLQVDGWEWAAFDENGERILDENGDSVGNRVWGTAQPTGHTGIIKLRIDDDLGMRMVDVAPDGTWVVDFNLPPDEEGEWGDEVYLGPGMGGSVHLRGDDGNLAWASWGEHGGGGPGELHLHAMAYGSEWLSGEGLPSGMYVIQIEGAGECSNLVYREGSEFHVDAGELCDDGDLMPGHRVVVSAVAEDGVSPGQLIAEFTIDGVVISGADVDTRTVWGLATDGKPVTVALFDESTEEPVAWRTVDLANGQSEWSVDFLTAPGPDTEDNWGTGALAGRSVRAAQFDGQGHTESDWVEAEPRLFVNLIEDFVQLSGWPGDLPAMLRILESDAADAAVVYEEQIVASSPYYVLFTQLDLGGFDVLAGQRVVASADDGSVEVAHTVSELSITGVDFELDLLAGTATNGADHHLLVGVGNESGEAQLEPAGSPWTADFNGLVDFSATNAIQGFVAEFDTGESATFFQFEAEYQEFVVPPGGGSVGTGDGTVVIGNLGDGDNVGIVEGPVPPSTSEFDYVGGTYELIWEGTPRTFADPLILTFRIPGDEIPAGLNLDAIFVFKDGIEAPDCPAVPDSDGDFPCVLERIRDEASGDVLITVQALTAGVWIAAIPGGGVDPDLHAVVYGADWIHGEGLPPAGYVLWIQDAAECQSALYLSGSEFHVDGTELCADGDLQPDHHVVVSTIGSDGLPYRTIAEFTIDGVVISGADVDTGEVWGLATAGKPVTVALFDENTGEAMAWRTVVLDPGVAEWSVDFSTALDPETEDNWGSGGLDGRSVWAVQFDGQGHTESDWVDVEPHLYANRIADSVVLENWPTGESITLEVFASDAAGALSLYAESIPAPGPYYVVNSHAGLNGFDLLAGHYVVATAGSLEIAHTITTVGVTSIDFAEDSYDGIATADGSVVRTGVWYEVAGARPEGFVEFDATPSWTADFTDQGLDFSATSRIEGFVAEFDADGNATFYEFAAEYEVLTIDNGTATTSDGNVKITGLDGANSVSVTQNQSADVGDGYQTVGTSVDVDGTDQDGNPIVRDFEAGDQPLILTLRIVGDDMSEGMSLDDILVFRNGIEVPDCPVVLQRNSDFPCVSERAWFSGDVVLTVQTLAFSTWTTALRLVDIADFSATAEPIRVDVPVDASGSFDAGGTDFTAMVDWGDGACSLVDVSDGEFHTTHRYAGPGVYTLVLEAYVGSRTCSDEAGGDPIDSALHQYVVVYDPDGGFVTGGGWIDSPAGAYTPDPALTGPANFGFVSKYKKGKLLPDGNANFQFQTAGLHFQSSEFEWLVITGGDHAKFKGLGTINGFGDYGFMITAVDDPDGDTFRIKIWDRSTGDTVYDNKMSVGDDQYDATLLSGGSIVVHDGK